MLREPERAFLLGVNYWPRAKAMGWWADFDPGEVREELAMIRDLGIGVVRVFLLWESFQPRPDAVEASALRDLAIVGDLTHSRVFRSNVLLLHKLGAHVTVVAPPTLMPAGVTAWAKDAGFTTTYDLDEVLPDADAVMMLRVQRERMNGAYFPSAREYTVGYGLTRDRLAVLKPDAPICHPGPMNRGLEIAADAADAAQSAVLDQVSAGVAIRMSVLYHLLAGEGSAT